MNNNKKITPESEHTKPKLRLETIFYHNTFVLVFAFLCSIIIWFTMAANNSLGRPRLVYDVPLDIQLSDAAQAEGIRVFSQSYKKADVSISGSSAIINRVTADDLTVIANLSPVSAKLSGNTMQTETLPLSAVKKGNIYSDYEVSSVSPKEINVIYDKYKEKTFIIENNLKYTAGPNFHISTPVISDTQVVVSGPESSINKISRIALDHEIPEVISESKSFSGALTVYDQSNKVLKLGDLYLTLNISSVDVALEVLSKQTVTLDATTLNVPEGFSESRITIEPETIDIAGELATVSKYKTITLPNAINFADVNTKTVVFEMEIPMPAGVKNVSNVTKAKVTINLNGFKEATLNVENLKFVNVPDDKSVTLVAKLLQVDVVGSTAQISRLTSESIYGTIDMAQLTEKNGNVEVPVAMSISSSTSCWVYGQYTVHVNVQDKKAGQSSSILSSKP